MDINIWRHKNTGADRVDTGDTGSDGFMPGLEKIGYAAGAAVGIGVVGGRTVMIPLAGST